MNQLLSPGQSVVAAHAGIEITVEQYLGGGAQGEVYRAGAGGLPLALKWFFPHTLESDPGLHERLRKAVDAGSPSDRFLWPSDLAVAPAQGPSLAGFGYIMPLREPRFAGMVDLVTRRVVPSFRALATAGFELAHSYLQLHAKGLCYRDISFGNVFFDPETGEVRIADNDNVDENGRPGPIAGTPRFMAPEIVRGAAAPSADTDRFSLAVLLFYLLMNHHPLEGAREAAIRCFDLPAMTRLYGVEPRFIFDPQDESNRPLPGIHDNALAFWPLYPSVLRELFLRAFTVGLHDPQSRVRESEWRAALADVRDAIFYCTTCGAENFYDRARLQAGGPGRCWACAKPLRLPPRLRIAGASLAPRLVMLNHDAQLFPHHVDPAHAYDFTRPIAAIARHPQQPDVWGLRNLADNAWTAAPAGGSLREVAPGRSVTLAEGTRIQFGAAEGEIRLNDA